MTDLLEFFSVQPKIVSGPTRFRRPAASGKDFEFKNVSFSYPGSSRLVLKNVNFTLDAFRAHRLVGENGQGKTTIVKLLTRLYDPTEGQILLDRRRPARIRSRQISGKEIGVIFQDFMRYEMTASENIAVGRIEERHNPFRIRAAANKSLAEKVIRKLPKGYDQSPRIAL